MNMERERDSTNGMDRVLFVRCNKDLLRALERLKTKRSRKNRGMLLTTSDLVRGLLWQAIIDAADREEAEEVARQSTPTLE